MIEQANFTNFKAQVLIASYPARLGEEPPQVRLWTVVEPNLDIMWYEIRLEGKVICETRFADALKRFNSLANTA